jgi:hypothetical protein
MINRAIRLGVERFPRYNTGLIAGFMFMYSEDVEEGLLILTDLMARGIIRNSGNTKPPIIEI